MTYTSNWPHEPLIDNKPTAQAFLWTFISVLVLIGGIGLLCWFFLREREEWQRDVKPEEGYGDVNPMSTVSLTPSMLAVKKYIWTVGALLVLQILLGTVTAHYAVEGHDFYGIPLSEIVPYALTRTWHVQLAIIWIATAWLGAGLYLGPLIAGVEPKFQKLGANALWLALVVAVLGSLIWEWLTITGRVTDPAMVYWFGHQGYEFLDMGRFWQTLIFAGLLLLCRVDLPTVANRWSDRMLNWIFWLFNIGLALMVFGSLLPQGLLQAYVSFSEGYWHARTAEFMH